MSARIVHNHPAFHLSNCISINEILGTILVNIDEKHLHKLIRIIKYKTVRFYPEVTVQKVVIYIRSNMVLYTPKFAYETPGICSMKSISFIWYAARWPRNSIQRCVLMSKIHRRYISEAYSEKFVKLISVFRSSRVGKWLAGPIYQ